MQSLLFLKGQIKYDIKISSYKTLKEHILSFTSISVLKFQTGEKKNSTKFQSHTLCSNIYSMHLVSLKNILVDLQDCGTCRYMAK